MTLKIFHIADLHLGLRFNNHHEAQETLVQARYDTLKKLVELANNKDADILAIAGDLFDKTGMKILEIQQAVHAINQFEGNVLLVLPGNHDFISEESQLWDKFKNEAGNNVLVLDKTELVKLSDYDLNAVVYPAPCHSKHSSKNTIGWVKDEEKDPEKIHIGIAHGSIEGVSPDFDQRYYPMSIRELQVAGTDIWLMGHTHITWPEKPGKKDIIFNPGTPEPDGVSCTHEGRAYLHTIGDEKDISTEILSTGSYRFQRLERTINNQSDLEKLLNEFQNVNWKNSVIKLSVGGRLEPWVFDQWMEIRHFIRDAVLELKLDDSRLQRKVTAEQIRKEFSQGSFPEKLLTSFSDSEEEELQMAYEIIREVKE